MRNEIIKPKAQIKMVNIRSEKLVDGRCRITMPGKLAMSPACKFSNPKPVKRGIPTESDASNGDMPDSLRFFKFKKIFNFLNKKLEPSLSHLNSSPD